MPEGSVVVSPEGIADKVVAIREKWHTKKHPFFQAMLDGSLPLRALGVYMAQHLKFVNYVVPSFGFLYWRGPSDIRRMIAENMAEEEGLMAIPKPGHVPHDHFEMISDFCRHAGLSDEEIENTKPTPGWWARTLFYCHVNREEPLGVALAMASTQEGQQVALNNEITIPSFAKHYGLRKEDPEIAFFVEHAEADLEHSTRQLDLCAKYIRTPEEAARALEVCETAVHLRWASTNDIWRLEVLGETDMLPDGVSG
ncbi:MAG: hypothetical protein F4114_10305 [Rhodospirillaceae bacterium]|nr:hypothetical protein [Rhodospirillaceae bacterium]MYB12724.1 hypothetical protein [Rhodospirillaceae bacterium]MYI49463.1 hypothetical protein [Rhodospirillaceae bacterium]